MVVAYVLLYNKQEAPRSMTSRISAFVLPSAADMEWAELTTEDVVQGYAPRRISFISFASYSLPA